jgi:hypothetical protein
MNEAPMQANATLSATRVEQFKQEVADLKLSTASDGRERALLGLSVVLMIAGVVIGFGGFMSTTSLDDPRDQNEMIVLALAGVSLAVTGAALFLRYSMGRFLRFWLLRQIYEGQEHVERLAERLGR